MTPCALIRGVITEVGVAESEAYIRGGATTGLLDAGGGFNKGSEGKGIIDLVAFLTANGKGRSDARFKSAVVPTGVPFNYRRLDEASVPAYVGSVPKLCAVLGVPPGAEGAAQLTVKVQTRFSFANLL